jgi:DNA invertase Pin-like site-specific DNA recombinase
MAAPGKKYKPEQIEKVYELLEKGTTYRDIAKKTGINEYAVAFWARRRKKAAHSQQTRTAEPVARQAGAEFGKDDLILARLDHIIMMLTQMKDR